MNNPTHGITPLNEPANFLRKPVHLSWFAVLAVSLLLMGTWLRFWNLGYGAYHHDETIHAKHSYDLYQGVQHPYDPVYHGQFLYYHGAFWFWLLGDNDFTGRFPFAFVGILNLGLILLIRKRAGNTATLWALGFTALSASMTYFSRFARNDVYMAAWAMGILGFALLYFDTRRKDAFWWMALCFALLYATKENSLMTGFIFCFWLVLLVVLRALWGDWREVVRDVAVRYRPLSMLVILYGCYTIAQFFFAYIPIHGSVDWEVYPGELSINNIRSELSTWYANHPLFSWSWWIFWAAAVGAGWTILHRLHRRFQPDLDNHEPHPPQPTRFFYSDWLLTGGALLIILSVWIFLFTDAFRSTLWQGITGTVVDYVSYWICIQEVRPRIDNVRWYYLPRLGLYESLLCALSVIATIYYFIQLGMLLATGKSSVKCLSFRLFLVYWTWMAIGIYAILREMVPWLIVHQVQPMCLLSGVFLGDFFQQVRSWYGRTAIGIPVTIGLGWAVHSTVLLVFYYPDDPRELNVFTQSTHHVVEVRDEIEQHRHRLGLSRENMVVHVEPFASWPYAWYLRRFQQRSGVLRDAYVPVVLAGTADGARLRRVLSQTHAVREYPMRAWWVPQPLSQDNWWNQFWSYLWYREIWNPKGAQNMLVFVRHDLMGTAPLDPDTESASEELTIPIGYHLPPTAVQTIQTLGIDGQLSPALNYPRDISVDQFGQVFVVDTDNHRIVVFDPEGQLLNIIGQQGNETGQFERPSSIVVDSEGNLYITDTWNHRVQVLNPQGTGLRIMRPSSGFFGPRGIAIDPALERIYVTDTGNKRVVVFSFQGVQLNEWGIGGDLPGQFQEPVGIAVDDQHRVYVADTGNQRVQVFQSDGSFIAQWSVDGWSDFHTEPFLAFDKEGGLLATDSSGSVVHRFTGLGEAVQLFGEHGQGTHQWRNPKGIAVAPDGTVYVSDTNNQRILQVQPFH